MRISLPIVTLAVVALAAAPLAAKDHPKAHGSKPAVERATPPGHGGTPPGLAKKGGMPPGLAKRFGRPLPQRVYVALDPRREDRAWFLIENRWVERTGFDAAVRVEVRDSLRLPAIPLPPVPPPLAHLHVVLFGS
jgi:hypothetical protein